MPKPISQKGIEKHAKMTFSQRMPGPKIAGPPSAKVVQKAMKPVQKVANPSIAQVPALMPIGGT